MATFWEKYKDPRWQKRRLQIMDRSGFSCENCGDSQTTLNVHHKLYRNGAGPWEYTDEELECLCKPCHEAKHETQDLLKKILASSDFNSEDMMAVVAGFLNANDSVDPALAEMARQRSPIYYDIGLAAASVEQGMFVFHDHEAAKDTVKKYQKGHVTPAIKLALEDWKEPDGQG